MVLQTNTKKISGIYAMLFIITFYIFQAVLFMKNKVDTDVITIILLIIATLMYPILDKFLKTINFGQERLIIALMFYTNIAYILNYVLDDESTKTIKTLRNHTLIAICFSLISTTLIYTFNINTTGYFLPNVALFTGLLFIFKEIRKIKVPEDITPYLIIYGLIVYIMYDTRKCLHMKSNKCIDSNMLDMFDLMSLYIKR